MILDDRPVGAVWCFLENFETSQRTASQISFFPNLWHCRLIQIVQVEMMMAKTANGLEIPIASRLKKSI